MESFVQMSLREYDILKFGSEDLKRELKEEQESHSDDVTEAQKKINDLVEKIEKYKQYILECRCKLLEVDTYSLERYLDIDSPYYGMYFKDELLNLGFTKQEMDEFIVDKYEELGWLDEKTCTNLSEFDSIDEFECSNCGIVLSEYQQIEIDEDDGERFFYDYRPKHCPNCGRKIVD